MNIEKIVSAIQNDVVSGLPGLSSHLRFSLEQIEDDVIEERLAIIKEYSIKNLLPVKDLLLTISCIPVDCEQIHSCCGENITAPERHFKIPQTLNDFGADGIRYVGTIDMQLPFKVYTDHGFKRHRNRVRGSQKPFVWINTTPGKDGFYNGYIFNAPMIEVLTITAVFKDPRQLEAYSCCNTEMFDNKTFLDTEIRKRLTERYIRYYRQMATAQGTNDQTIL